MWDADEARARGFACPREWKQRLTSTEYEREKALSRKYYRGDASRDIGLAKAATFIAGSLGGVKAGFDLSVLLPNTPVDEQSADDIARELERCQAAPLEH